jgi:hypothetical protein
MTVSEAAIPSLRQDEDRDRAVVQINGSLNPGNSGGPIVNANGELVGMAVAIIRNSSGIRLAIPAGPLGNLRRCGSFRPATRPPNRGNQNEAADKSDGVTGRMSPGVGDEWDMLVRRNLARQPSDEEHCLPTAQ